MVTWLRMIGYRSVSWINQGLCSIMGQCYVIYVWLSLHGRSRSGFFSVYVFGLLFFILTVSDPCIYPFWYMFCVFRTICWLRLLLSVVAKRVFGLSLAVFVFALCSVSLVFGEARRIGPGPGSDGGQCCRFEPSPSEKRRLLLRDLV